VRELEQKKEIKSQQYIN